jgi:hypothetical protein
MILLHKGKKSLGRLIYTRKSGFFDLSSQNIVDHPP